MFSYIFNQFCWTCLLPNLHSVHQIKCEPLNNFLIHTECNWNDKFFKSEGWRKTSKTNRAYISLLKTYIHWLCDHFGGCSLWSCWAVLHYAERWFFDLNRMNKILDSQYLPQTKSSKITTQLNQHLSDLLNL